jgi:acetyl esterase
MPLDPQVTALLEQMNAQGLPPFEQMTVDQAREVSSNIAGLQAEPPSIASVENRAVPGPAGDIPVRIYTPTGEAPRPLLVYYHGGGWTIGTLDVADKPCRALAAATSSVVVSVDYRMGPEHKFPAAVEDCYAATRWAADHAAELGADPERLVVIGDSAGGNLAAVISLIARERGGPRIAYQVLIYPVTDYAFDTPSYEQNADGYMLTREAMRWFWGNYLSSEADGAHPHASPLRASELAGLPPALVVTCEFDPLRDEGEAYGQRLGEAGVAVKVSRYDGMIHGFFLMSGAISRNQALLDEIAAELRSALRAPATSRA